MDNEIETCARIRRDESMIFPAKVFAYLAQCENVKRNVNRVIRESEVIIGDLPFVSSLTNQFSPQAAVHAHWSFLKY